MAIVGIRYRHFQPAAYHQLPDSLESLLLADLASSAADHAIDATGNGVDSGSGGGAVDVCAEFGECSGRLSSVSVSVFPLFRPLGECDHLYEFPSIVEEEDDETEEAIDVPEGADVRFEQVYPDKGLPYYR